MEQTHVSCVPGSTKLARDNVSGISAKNDAMFLRGRTTKDFKGCSDHWFIEYDGDAKGRTGDDPPRTR